MVGRGAPALPYQGVVERRNIHPTVPLGQLLCPQIGIIPDLKKNRSPQRPGNQAAMEAGAEPEVSWVRAELARVPQPPRTRVEASREMNRSHVLPTVPRGPVLLQRIKPGQPAMLGTVNPKASWVVSTPNQPVAWKKEGREGRRDGGRTDGWME